MTAARVSMIRNAEILDVRTGTLRRGDIRVEGDAIEETGPGLAGSGPGVEIDAEGMIAIPGLVNAHTHAHNNLTKGKGDNWTLEDLRNNGPVLYGNRSPEDQYLSAAIGAIEMLKTGCTAAYDQFAEVPTATGEGIAAVVQAYVDVGVRAVLAPAVSDIPFHRAVPGLIEALPDDLAGRIALPSASVAASLVATVREAVRRWNGAGDGLVTMATAPVIPGECTDELMLGCRDVAREQGVGLHTHLAETKIQAIAATRRWGRSIVGRLEELDVLGPRFVAGHAVWIDADDILRLADSGATVAHNPASNLKLGSGLAPVREMLDAGLTVGVGADGSMSSDNQNLFEAMRIAALIGKVRFPHRPDRWVGARDALRMATLDGARVLGLADEIGAIEPGRKADVVLLDADSPFLRPLSDAVNALVYCETGADVREVIVGGRLVVSAGRVATVDETAIRARAQRALRRLDAEAAASRELARRIEPILRAACARCASSPYPIDRYAAPVG